MLLRNCIAFRYLTIALFFLPGLRTISSAQSLKYSKSLFQNKDWSFVENKGQIPTPNPRQRGTATNNVIKYYGHQGGVYLYCKPGMISFVFTRKEKEPGQVSEATGRGVSDVGVQNSEPLHRKPFDRHTLGDGSSTVTTSRADLVFLGANPSAQILASDQQEYYENYYTTGNADSGITNVHTFKTITYKLIYPHIDMVLACREKGMEYSFVVYPGGKVSDIQMQWEGIEGIKKLKDSKIEYSCALGKIDESAPYSFVRADPCVRPVSGPRADTRVRPYTIQSKIESQFFFNKKNNRFGFKVDGYDKSKVLVIDPTLEWGTYFGGGPEYRPNIAADISGNVYITGDVYRQSIIATSGAYQTKYDGVGDAFLAKFDSSGSLKWATYFGGGDGEVCGFAVAVDGSGNACITGFTESSTFHLATNGAYQTSLAGGEYTDAFLAKFNSNGSLQWATYYGGNLWDEGWGVATDAYSNIYITGWTESSSGIATNGAYLTYLSGSVYSNGDAFLAKFNASGSLQWATYYGETYGNFTNPTFGRGIAVDKFSNAYITGYTYSLNGIATSNAYKTSLTGWPNAFLAKFNAQGSLQWGTYYGGSYANYGASGDDESYGVALDSSNNAYITGYTNSGSGIATNGAYDTVFEGDSIKHNAFLAKFNSSGSLKWATYFGGSGDDEGWGVAVDVSSNAYITGYTNSLGNIATAGAYRTSNAGGTDVFLAKFNSIGALKWSSYYGGSGYDAGFGVVTDGFGNLYLVGNTESTSGIATSGAYQTSFNSNYPAINAFLSKFSFKISNDAGISSISNPFGPGFCPGTDTVKVKLKNYGSDNLTKVNIQWSINHQTQTTYEWTGLLKPDSTVLVSLGAINFLAGNDTIKAWTSMPNGFRDSIPQNDMAIVIDTVHALPLATVVTANIAICKGTSKAIGAVSVKGSTYSWTSSPSGFTSTSSNPSVSPALTTSYTLSETNSYGCKASNSVIITINTLPAATVISNTAICSGAAISIGATAVAGSTYAWTSSPSGFSSSASNPSVSPTSATSYTLTEINSNGCKASNSVTINVNILPVDSLIANTTICSGAAISIGGKAVTGSSYLWTSSPSGFSSTVSNPSVMPISTTSYTLTEINLHGCSKTDSVKITILPLPKPVAGPSKTICSYDTVTIGGNAVNGYTYYWHSTFHNSYPYASRIRVNPPITEWFYIAAVDTSGCIGTDSVLIHVNPLPKPTINGNLRPCQNFSPNIYSTPMDSGAKYAWTIRPGSIISGQGTDSVKVTLLDSFNNLSVKETNIYGCSKIDYVSVYVLDAPDAHFKLLSDSPVHIFKAIDSTEQYYQWLFGDGATGSNYLVSHKYLFDRDSSLDVSLTVGSAFGCSATFDSIIKIHYISPPNFYIEVFPTPFGQTTNIKISLEQSSHIQIVAYDAIGRLIGKLIDTEQPSGVTDYGFNAAKYSLAQGVYYLKILVDGKVYIRPIVKE